MMVGKQDGYYLLLLFIENEMYQPTPLPMASWTELQQNGYIASDVFSFLLEICIIPFQLMDMHYAVLIKISIQIFIKIYSQFSTNN